MLQSEKNSKEAICLRNGSNRAINIVLGLVWLLIILFCALNLRNFTVEEILNLTPDILFLAALLMTALFALKSLSIFIYSGILFTVNGIIFPVALAIFMDCVGIAVMSTIPFFLGRRLGKRGLTAIKEKYPAFMELDRLGHDNEFVFTLILRLIHFLPSDIVSIFLGANDFSYPRYLAASVLGVMPSAIMFSLMGTSVSEPGSPQFIISTVAQIGIILFSFVAAAMLKRRKASAHSDAAEEGI